MRGRKSMMTQSTKHVSWYANRMAVICDSPQHGACFYLIWGWILNIKHAHSPQTYSGIVIWIRTRPDFLCCHLIVNCDVIVPSDLILSQNRFCLGMVFADVFPSVDGFTLGYINGLIMQQSWWSRPLSLYVLPIKANICVYINDDTCIA